MLRGSEPPICFRLIRSVRNAAAWSPFQLAAASHSTIRSRGGQKRIDLRSECAEPCDASAGFQRGWCGGRKAF